MFKLGNKKLVAFLFVVALLAFQANVRGLSFGEWTTDVGAAKSLALSTGRPMLAMIGPNTCAHCDNLYKALNTQAFKTFANENQLVLYRCQDDALQAQVRSDWKKKSGLGALTPYFMLFKVKSATVTSSMALAPDQVDVAQVTWATTENPYCGRSYMEGGKIFGVQLESSQANWNAAKTQKVVEAFFPNNYWQTLQSDGGGTGGGTGGDDTGGGTGGDIGGGDTGGDDTGGDIVYEDEDKWCGVWLTNLADAKRYAYKNDRPILAVIGPYTCAHCDYLYNKSLSTQAFLDFAKEKKLVLFRCMNDAMQAQVRSDWKKKCGLGALTPYFMLFKVLDTANLADGSSTGLSPSQVDVAQVTWGTTENPYCGRSYTEGGKIFGVQIESSQSYWKPATTQKVVETFFPNNYWKKIDGGSSSGGGGDSGDDGGDDDDDDEIYDDEDQWCGVWLTNLADAKRYAYKNNRPILAEIGPNTCAHCDYLYDNALKTAAFLAFAKEKKLVLFRCQSDAMQAQVRSDWKKKCGLGALTPYFMLFKVLDTADLTDGSSEGLSPSQVDVAQVAWATSENPYCGRSYTEGGSIFGVKLESSQVNWNAATTRRVVEVFFPNNYWQTIEPPAPSGPSGYENATDFGRIPNAANPPDGYNWVASSGSVELKGKSAEAWFKLTGDQGKRYWFYPREVAVSDTMYATTNYSYVVELYATKKNAPATPALVTYEYSSFEKFSHGFWLDTPSGSALDQTYYLKVIASGGTSSNCGIMLDMRVHETIKAPVNGSMTNPYWSGAMIGKWTMDMDTAMANAFSRGKPLLLYFSGLGWCPYCCGMEHLVFSQTSFSSLTADSYNVILDFQRRDGTGPSPLVDENSVGYLATHSLTLQQGLAKLAANRQIQEALSLPGTERDGWPDGSIGYPTLVYCRVERVNNNYQAVPVGRVSWTTLEELTAKMADFQSLFEIGFNEFSMYNQTSDKVYDAAGGTDNVPAGQMIARQWSKFSVDDGRTWVFNVGQVDGADSAAKIILSIYKADGSTLLRRSEISMVTGGSFLFMPSDSNMQDYWLCIESSGQTGLVSVPLSYSQQEDIVARIDFARTEVAVARGTKTVSLPLKLTYLKPASGAEIKFQYSVMAADSSAAGWFVPCTDTPFTWGNPQDTEDALEITLKNVMITPDWDGSKDVLVRLSAVDDGKCVIGMGEATIQICAKPAFLPEPPQTDFVLCKGLMTTLDFPVCAFSGMDYVANTSRMPAGLSLVDNTGDASNPRFTICGVPTVAVSNPVEVAVYLRKSSSSPLEWDEPHALTVSLTVVDMNIDVLPFTACLKRSSHEGDESAFDGLCYVEPTNSGLEVTIVTQDSERPLHQVVVGWTSYDSDTHAVALDMEFEGGERLNILYGADYSGSVSFVSSIGDVFSGDIRIVTDMPEEYAGVYNVALRDYDDLDGSTEGWINMTIDERGIVNGRIQVYDGNATQNFTTCLFNDANGHGMVYFFMPLVWDEGLQVFAGKVHGCLEITPYSERMAHYADAWVSSCNDRTSLLEFERDSQSAIRLSPCGTVFDSSISISEAVETDVFYFVTEAPSSEAVVTPNFLRFHERELLNLAPLDNGILSSETGPMVIDKDLGTFEMSMNILSIGDGGVIERVPVLVSGVIVPTALSCCAFTDNVASAYGAFEYKGVIYRMRLFPDGAYSRMMAPSIDIVRTVRTDNGYAHIVDCEPAVASGLNALLVRSVETGDLAFHCWSGPSPLRLEMDGEGAQCSFIAVDDRLVEAGIVMESPLVNVDAAVSVTYGTIADCDVRLRPGWNLIGIPHGLHIGADAILGDVDYMGYDIESGSYVFTPSVKTGGAYWVYVPTGGAMFEVCGVPRAMDAIEIPQGWSLMAFPGLRGDAVIYEYAPDGRLKEVVTERPETTGVWIFTE